jgi:exosortase family protein XrtF
MLKYITENKILFFLLKAFGLYLFWYILYDLWLHPSSTLDNLVSTNLAFWSSLILKSLGFIAIDSNAVSTDNITVIGIDGTHGLWVGDPCNGITLFALFVGFVIAYPGKIKNKLWFIPIGMLSIHIINILRIVALCLIVYYSPESLAFNHTYTFTILVYAFIFWLWLLWSNKFSNYTNSTSSKVDTK